MAAFLVLVAIQSFFFRPHTEKSLARESPGASLSRDEGSGGLGCAPQYHWTDQKLKVHAFGCVVAYLLLKLLERRAARQAGLPIRSSRALLHALQAIREVIVIEAAPTGRPRVGRQLEELSSEARGLAACFGLVPESVVTTGVPQPTPRHSTHSGLARSRSE